MGGGPTPGIGETFALPPPPDHVWSGFVYVKLKIKEEREEAGLKERKKKEASEGREGGKERQA